MRDAESKRVGPTLADALQATFRPDQPFETFIVNLCRLARVMTTASDVHVVSVQQSQVLASDPADAQLPAATVRWASDIAVPNGKVAEPSEGNGALAIPVVVPGGGHVVLVVQMQSVGTVTRALAFERLVGLNQLANATFRHPDVRAIESLLENARSSEADGDALASQIRQMTDSDLVAIGRIMNGDMAELFLSDHPQSTKRASLPGQLKTEMLNALQAPERHPEYYVAEQNGSAVALKVENARRNENLAPIFAQILNSGQGMASSQRNRRTRRVVKYACFALVAIGIVMVPLPDARRVPAEVIASQSRTITAPFSGVVLDVEVDDSDTVQAGDSLLVRLDPGPTLRELASAQADYAKALLDRESARGERDATACGMLNLKRKVCAPGSTCWKHAGPRPN